jgi:hypothetical protein
MTQDDVNVVKNIAVLEASRTGRLSSFIVRANKLLVLKLVSVVSQELYVITSLVLS